MVKKDYFYNLLKSICELDNLSFQKIKFEHTDKNIYINIKNNVKENVELEVMEILSKIYHILVPLKIDFTHQLYLYPNRKGLDKFVLVFKKEDYLQLNLKLETGDI